MGVAGRELLLYPGIDEWHHLKNTSLHFKTRMFLEPRQCVKLIYALSKKGSDTNTLLVSSPLLLITSSR